MSVKPQIPIVNLGYLNAYGCVHSNILGDSVNISISPGQLRDSTNTFDIIVNEPLTVSTAFNGAGGLDQGTVAVNTIYGVYVLYDSSQVNNPVGILSLSGTPLMPSINGVTYSHFRCIGFIKTQFASTNLHSFDICGTGNDRVHLWADDQNAILGGTATTLTPISLSAGVPSGLQFLPNSPQSIAVILSVFFTPVAPLDSIEIWPFNTGLGATSVFFGQVASVILANQITTAANLTISGDYEIKYRIASVTGGSVDLDIDGFMYTI
jgi:hypothetical protein